MLRALPLALTLTGCGFAISDSGLDSGPDPTPYDQAAIQDVLDLPGSPYDYQTVPASFLAPGVAALDNTPAFNPITDTGATLGRVLFYDTALSANRSVACASCHQGATGFADAEVSSSGFDGGLTRRNSMSLVNVRYYPSGAMFWDERAASLEEQVLMPIQDGTEMGMTLEDVVARLEATGYYPLLFAIAYGDPQITSERIAAALAQFVRANVSAGSLYDEGLAEAGNPGAAFANFTPQQNRGKQLFFAPPPAGGVGCAGCHVANRPGRPPANPVVFLGARPRNNGLTATSTGDLGLAETTGIAADEGLFKSPSLRNVALTAPYMHDGSLLTLEEVVEHYNNNIQDHPNLDPLLRQGFDGPPIQLGLGPADVAALVAFLETLTDPGPATDPRFANPFR